MTQFRSRTALPLSTVLLVTALGLLGCSSPGSTTDVDGGSSAAPTEETTGGSAVGCPPEMDTIASAGGQMDFERVEPADFFLPGLDAALLAEACLYEFTTDGKSAQWAWFRGADAAAVAADITAALAAAGYTLTDEFEGAQLYASPTEPQLTVSTLATAEDAAATDGGAIFDLLGPTVQVFQYFS